MNKDYIFIDMTRQLKRIADALEESNKMIRDLGRLDENDIKDLRLGDSND